MSMRPRRRIAAGCTALATISVLVTAPSIATAAPTPTPGHHTGTLADGAAWIADVPAAWNGTLLLFSHGFGPTAAQDAPDPATESALLAAGYALAGSSYRGGAWRFLTA